MTQDDGGPAFPSHGSMGEVVQGGLSLRDYFAAAALNVLVLKYGGGAMRWPKRTARVAARAYNIADALLAERRKG